MGNLTPVLVRDVGLLMKKWLFAGIMLSAAANAATPAPYTFLLHFPDGSLEICTASDFSIGFPQSDVTVQGCLPDAIFSGTFDG